MILPAQTKPFIPNPKQQKLLDIIGGDPEVTDLLAFGPSRSGKTTIFSAAFHNRAIMYPGTRHAVFRLTSRSVRAHLFNDTYKATVKQLDPSYWSWLENNNRINRSEMRITYHNGSEIIFEGLDPNNIDKILGAQYATAWINECNEIRDYGIVQQLASRMAEKAFLTDPKSGKPYLVGGEPVKMRTLMLYDCNPDVKTDWDYRGFVEKVQPASGKPMSEAEARGWKAVFVPARENAHNLQDNYVERLASRYDGSPEQEARFLHGVWRDDNPYAMFQRAWFTYAQLDDPCYVQGGERRGEVDKGFFLSIIVAVDPSGNDGNRGDDTGIVVAGMGRDGRVYILEDASVRGAPALWAVEVSRMYREWEADLVVAEKNFGGTMVEHTIKTAHRNIPVKMVPASRGKLVRAQPVAEAYRAGKVIHLSNLKELEAQMCAYKSDTAKSPDRMDACVWAVTHLLRIGQGSGTICSTGPARLPGY